MTNRAIFILSIAAPIVGIIFILSMWANLIQDFGIKASQSYMPSAVYDTFDHSNCQYPDRLSNPVDGCDNSDPARPECMKFGTEDCSVVEPIVTQPTPVEVVQLCN